MVKMPSFDEIRETKQAELEFIENIEIKELNCRDEIIEYEARFEYPEPRLRTFKGFRSSKQYVLEDELIDFFFVEKIKPLIKERLAAKSNSYFFTSLEDWDLDVSRRTLGKPDRLVFKIEAEKVEL
jgi:hypothetical protein